MKTALVTGITGQDGSYLAELLLAKGYEVHGIRRQVSSDNTGRIAHLLDADRVRLHHADLADGGSLIRLLARIHPDEIYNLGAASQVALSFEQPELAADVDGIGALRLLEAVRLLGLGTSARFFQAASSELFGLVGQAPHHEATPFHPGSPYACAKLYAYWITVNYREAYGMYACNGIMFNHESPRRGESFVTRKISRAIARIARIARGSAEPLRLGNLDARRDWGHARDYVDMMWRMLQQDAPEDFVIATGRQESVRRFVELCCAHVGIPIRWQGSGVEARGIDGRSGRVVVEVDPRHFRPLDPAAVLGDPAKAHARLGWRATTGLERLVAEMMEHDLALSDADAARDEMP